MGSVRRSSRGLAGPSGDSASPVASQTAYYHQGHRRVEQDPSPEERGLRHGGGNPQVEGKDEVVEADRLEPVSWKAASPRRRRAAHARPQDGPARRDSRAHDEPTDEVRERYAEVPAGFRIV